jgi:hypothetical protein
MRPPLNPKQAVRYLYPGAVLPLARFMVTATKNPFDIVPVYGAVGFDFVRIYEFENEDGFLLDYQLADSETYYWGLELSRSELEQFNDFPDLNDHTGAERFALTCWGGYIPLSDNEIVVPYPEFQEIPADMRLP